MLNQSNLLSPNHGQGADLEKYSWIQGLKEVTVYVPVQTGTRAKDVTVEISPTRLKVGLKGHTPIIDGELFKNVLK